MTGVSLEEIIAELRQQIGEPANLIMLSLTGEGRLGLNANKKRRDYAKQQVNHWANSAAQIDARTYLRLTLLHQLVWVRATLSESRTAVWLTEPLPELDDRSPLQVLQQETPDKAIKIFDRALGIPLVRMVAQ